MKRFSDDFKQQIYDTCNIVDVISQYVSLSRSGRTMKGLCPFHGEKSPSFHVYGDTSSYYCFGCGASGNVITFVQAMENLSYTDAVKSLCDRYGIAVPDAPFDDSFSKKKRRMFEMNAEAARFFHNCLKEQQGKKCLSYYYSRGYSPKTITHFGLGYAPDDWRQLHDYLRSKGYSSSEIYEANLAGKSDKNGRVSFYDNFRNRAMVPIIDVRGRVIAFGGRVLDDSKPKYINTSDTYVYKKSKGVFGLNFAKNSKSKALILVEGYMDAIALHQAGFTNTIACLGTALTDEMALLLRQYCDEIILCYDNDEAGKKATDRAISIFDKVGLKQTVIRLEGGKDPDEILKKYGPERFRQLLEGKKSDTEFLLDKAAEKYDMESTDGRSKYLDEVCKILSGLNETDRSIYAGYAERVSNVRSEVILSRVGKERQSDIVREKTRKNNSLNREAEQNLNPKNGARILQENILLCLMKSPSFSDRCEKELAPLFDDPALKEILLLVLERYKAGLIISPKFMADELSPDANRALAKSAMNDNTKGAPYEQFEAWITALKEKQSKKGTPDVGKLSEEDFLEEFKKLREKKNR